MARISTQGPAVARPVKLSLNAVPSIPTVLAEADDYSVPDAQQVWPHRDPGDINRRIQPGEALIESPLFVYNGDPGEAVTITLDVELEDGTVIVHSVTRIPPGETASLPIAGQRLLKLDPDAAFGDRLRATASKANVLQVMASATKGATEEDQP
ncbi:hypothetical protein [Thalassococcus sp. S3]|uniref:hypothetical protein n=1 Tax=Thalassococcus sp. S3 TaxID=2017482 RepID=UPI00102412B9|nr:hypothetical protein [Thalassococcus sp. S3]QBF32136.1 hypothetical protein CFI11_13035 [Thalassococcus sp. S3]